MKLSGKTWLRIILKLAKRQGVTLSIESILLEKNKVSNIAKARTRELNCPVCCQFVKVNSQRWKRLSSMWLKESGLRRRFYEMLKQVENKKKNCLAKWLSVRLWTKWLWVQISLLSLRSVVLLILKAYWM